MIVKMLQFLKISTLQYGNNSSFRRFNYPNSTLFPLLLFHLKNCYTTSIKKDSYGLGRQLFSEKIKPHFISPCIFENADSRLLINEHRFDEDKNGYEESQTTLNKDNIVHQKKTLKNIVDEDF